MDVLVVGSGIAGLTSALHAQEAGHAVTLVTKGRLDDGCTRLAQGGMAGVYGPHDSAEQHAADTLAAGAGLSDAAAVEVLVSDGATRIAELIRRGVAFDRAADGTLSLGREAAHSHARIVHAGGDATGSAISRALIDAVPRAGITVSEYAFLVDLIVAAGAVRGIRMLRDGALVDLAADAVILATGGAGQLFARTTNPAGVTGDGIAAALRAGAAVADLEFMQFHPTVLAGGPAFLISEAVRGEGATLVDADGRRFMFDVHPDGELAPRDVVSRAIARQAARQGSDVRLDATASNAARLAERFPTIDRVTRERGFDWAREPIPVTPAAHYLMGGIVTDLDGRTTVPGLFAVGEAARTGVHGANRLASNSLLEGTVFGARAAAALGTSAGFRPPVPDLHHPDPEVSHPVPELHHPVPELPHPVPELPHPVPELRDPVPEPVEGPGFFDRLRTRAAGTASHPDSLHSRADRERGPFSRTALQHLMWSHVGLLRMDDGLADALETIRAWRGQVPAPASVADHEDADLLLLAEAMASAALARTASVGAHHRTLRQPEGPAAEAPQPIAIGI